MEDEKFCFFNQEVTKQSDKWIPVVKESISTSNFKRSQSMRVSRTLKLKEEFEQRRKHLTLELNERFKDSTDRLVNEKSCDLVKQETKKKDTVERWIPSDKVEDFSSACIKSSNFKRSQSMRVSNRPQLKMEMQRKYMGMDAPRDIFYEDISSHVQVVPNKTSPREDGEDSTDRLVNEKSCDLVKQETKKKDTVERWIPSDKVEDFSSACIKSSNFKRSQSMRVSNRPQLKMEMQRKYMGMDAPRESFYEDISSHVQVVPNKTSPREDGEDSTDRLVNEKSCDLVKQETKKKDTVERWIPSDKVEDFSSACIKSSNFKRSQSMRVSNRPQLKMEMQRKYMGMDAPRESFYEDISSHVQVVPNKTSPREDGEDSTDRLVNEKSCDLVKQETKKKDTVERWIPSDKVEDFSSASIKPSNFKRSQSMRVSNRPQLKMEMQRKYMGMDAPRDIFYEDISSHVQVVHNKTSPREDGEDFVKSRKMVRDKEMADLCLDGSKNPDTVDTSSFRQIAEESSLMIEKPSGFKRSQSVRIPKRTQLKVGIEKQRKYVTLEEAESRQENCEQNTRILSNNSVMRRYVKWDSGTVKGDGRLMEIESNLTEGSRDTVAEQSVAQRKQKIEATENFIIQQSKPPWQSLRPKNVGTFKRDVNPNDTRDSYNDTVTRGIIATSWENKSSNASDRRRPTSYANLGRKSISSGRVIPENIAVSTKDTKVIGDREIVLHKKGSCPYPVSKTTTVINDKVRLKRSSVVPIYESPFYRHDFKVTDEYIRIWRFGQISEFITFQKEESVESAISKISKKLRVNSKAVDLFYQLKILNKTGSLGDQIETGAKDMVYIIVKQLSRQVPVGYFTDAPDIIDPWEDEIPRVLMSCGHGITCENLFEYCRRQIESGFAEFFCPAVPDQERPCEQCGSRWDFEEVRKKACLSEDESNLFEIMLSSNKIRQSKNIHKCPRCYKYIESMCCRRGFVLCKNCDEYYNCDFKFCVFCQRQWVDSDESSSCGHADCKTGLQRLQKILLTCPTKEIIGIQNCPSIRACPQCNYIVEHEGDNCKHMDCPSQYCRTKFCFVCLQIKTDKYYWPESCGGAFIHCQLAPRQSV